MIEKLFLAVAFLYLVAFIAWLVYLISSRSPSRWQPLNPIPPFKPRPKVTAAPPDKKQRREFSIFYMSGNSRSGVLYREGNIMMNDGELFSRLDQLVDERVMSIRFSIGEGGE